MVRFACFFVAVLVGCAGETTAPGSDLGGSPPVVDASQVPDMSAPPDMANPCNPATCAGCCMGSACQTGSTNAACGKAATQCQVCSGLDSCLAQQTCGLAPSKEWILTVVGASVSATAPDGSSWDFPGGAPDPFVTINSLYMSAVVPDSYNPQWNMNFSTTTARLLAGSDFIAMYDQDVSANDVIASSRAILMTEADIRAGKLEWKGWGSVISIKFTVAPK